MDVGNVLVHEDLGLDGADFSACVFLSALVVDHNKAKSFVLVNNNSSLMGSGVQLGITLFLNDGEVFSFHSYEEMGALVVQQNDLRVVVEEQDLRLVPIVEHDLRD